MNTEITQEKTSAISEVAENVVVDLLAEQGRIIESLKSKLSALAKENQELRAGMEVKDNAIYKAMWELDGDVPHQPQTCGQLGKPLCYLHSAITSTAGRDLLDRVENMREALKTIANFSISVWPRLAMNDVKEMKSIAKQALAEGGDAL